MNLKKLFNCMIALAVMLFAINFNQVSALASEEQAVVLSNTVATVYDETELIIALATGGEVVLGDNIDVDDTLVIPAGTTVVLDLNGKVVSQSKAQSNAYSMIENFGTLTIKDTMSGGKLEYADTTVYTGYVNYVSNTITNRGTVVSIVEINLHTLYLNFAFLVWSLILVLLLIDF